MENSEERVLFEVQAEDLIEFKRLDQFLVSRLETMSRSLVKKLFEKDQIKISSPSPWKVELKKMPPVGSCIEVCIPPPELADLLPENIPLDILFEDEYLLVINKPAGMVVHPGAGNWQGTLVNAILYHCKDLQGIGGVERPGIVHRLDKGTSGVMVVAKEQKTHEALVDLFARHDIERRYEALSLYKGDRLEGTIKSQIGRSQRDRQKMSSHCRHGKTAITHYKVLERFTHFSHMELRLETGRTHQIRVHLAEIMNGPVLMDPQYGNPVRHIRLLKTELAEKVGDYPYPFLHAKVLGFVHPITKQEMYFEQKAPDLFQEIIEKSRTAHKGDIDEEI